MLDIYKAFESIGGPKWDGFCDALVSCPEAFGYGRGSLDILADESYQKDLEKEFKQHQKEQRQKQAWLKRMLKNPEFVAWYKQKYGSLELR